MEGTLESSGKSSEPASQEDYAAFFEETETKNGPSSLPYSAADESQLLTPFVKLVGEQQVVPEVTLQRAHKRQAAFCDALTTFAKTRNSFTSIVDEEEDGRSLILSFLARPRPSSSEVSHSPPTETFPANPASGWLVFVVKVPISASVFQRWKIVLSSHQSIYVAAGGKWQLLSGFSAFKEVRFQKNNDFERWLTKVIESWDSYAANLSLFLQWLISACEATKSLGSFITISQPQDSAVTPSMASSANFSYMKLAFGMAHHLHPVTFKSSKGNDLLIGNHLLVVGVTLFMDQWPTATQKQGVPFIWTIFKELQGSTTIREQVQTSEFRKFDSEEQVRMLLEHLRDADKDTLEWVNDGTGESSKTDKKVLASRPYLLKVASNELVVLKKAYYGLLVETYDLLKPTVESAKGQIWWASKEMIEISFAKRPAAVLAEVVERIKITALYSSGSGRYMLSAWHYRFFDSNELNHVMPVSCAQQHFEHESIEKCHRSLECSVKALGFIEQLMELLLNMEDTELDGEPKPKLNVSQTPKLHSVVYTFGPAECSDQEKIIANIRLTPTGTQLELKRIEIHDGIEHEPVVVPCSSFPDDEPLGCLLKVPQKWLKRLIERFEQLNARFVEQKKTVLPLDLLVDSEELASKVPASLSELKNFIDRWKPEGKTAIKNNSFCCSMYLTKSLSLSQMQVLPQFQFKPLCHAAACTEDATFAALKFEIRYLPFASCKAFQGIIKITKNHKQVGWKMQTFKFTSECIEKLLSWAGGVLPENLESEAPVLFEPEQKKPNVDGTAAEELPERYQNLEPVAGSSRVTADQKSMNKELLSLHQAVDPAELIAQVPSSLPEVRNFISRWQLKGVAAEEHSQSINYFHCSMYLTRSFTLSQIEIQPEFQFRPLSAAAKCPCDAVFAALDFEIKCQPFSGEKVFHGRIKIIKNHKRIGWKTDTFSFTSGSVDRFLSWASQQLPCKLRSNPGKAPVLSNRKRQNAGVFAKQPSSKKKKVPLPAGPCLKLEPFGVRADQMMEEMKDQESSIEPKVKVEGDEGICLVKIEPFSCEKLFV